MFYLNIITTVFISLLLIGFLVGFLRGWKKSLVRFSIILAAILASVFLSPLISAALIKKFVKGTVFTGFGLNIDFESIVRDFVDDETFVADLFSAEATSTDLAKAFLNVGMNLVSFITMFLTIIILSLIVYWIVVLILKVKAKRANEIPLKDKKYWWLKVLGGGIGFVSSLAFCFVLFTPVFGVMRICDGFVEKPKTSASASNSFICGELYYNKTKNNETKVESYIDKYTNIKTTYDKSFVGGFLKYTGINALGNAAFNKLTTVESGGLRFDLCEEFVVLTKTYNTYKEVFVAQKFDVTDNKDIDGVVKIYETARESEVIQSYIQELLPRFVSRWTNDEKFLGMKMPIEGDFAPLAKDVLSVFNTIDLKRIDRNVKAVAKTVKVANNNGLVKYVQEEKDLVDFLTNNDVFVKQEVLALSSTSELKHIFPSVMNNFVEVAHKEIVGTDGEYEENTLTNAQINSIDWNREAETIQNITSKLLEVYDVTKDSTDASVMIDQLTNIGEIIDLSRESKVLCGPFKTFIKGFVSSSHFKLDDSIKTTINTNLDENWDSSTYKYMDMFGVLQETAIVAQNLKTGDGSIELGDLSSVLDKVVSSGDAESIKETLQTIVGSDAVGQMIGSSAEGNIVSDVLDAYLDPEAGVTNESLAADILAGQEILDMTQKANSADGFILEGETEEQKKESAKQTIENIAASDVLMGLLEDSANDEESSINQKISSLGGDVDILIESIEDADISDENKLILAKLFEQKNNG